MGDIFTFLDRDNVFIYYIYTTVVGHLRKDYERRN